MSSCGSRSIPPGPNDNVAAMQPQPFHPRRPSLYRRLVRNLRKPLRYRQHGRLVNTDSVTRGPDLAPTVESSNHVSPDFTPSGPDRLPGLVLGAPVQPIHEESGPSTQPQPSPVPSSLFMNTCCENDTTMTTPASATGQILVEAPIEQVSTGSKFKPTGYLTPSTRDKILVKFSLDTGAGVSTMRRSIYEQLDLPLQPCSGVLLPVGTGSGKSPIKPLGIVQQVAWHFSQRTKTYTADFHVIDDDQYDVIIGQPEIEQYALLQPSADIGPVVVRPL